jgi:malate dehydrogenase (quinone)
VDISQALEVNTEFDLSRQFWAYLVKKGAIADPRSFIHPVPHLSFVRGGQNVRFLQRRFAALSAHHCYRGMQYSDDRKHIQEWIPLVMEGRDPGEDVAATRMLTGTDVNYGALTRHLLDSVRGQDGFSIHFRHRVQDLHRDGNVWRVRVRMKAPVNTGRSPPGSCSSVPAAHRSPCCKNPGFPRGGVTPGSP